MYIKLVFTVLFLGFNFVSLCQNTTEIKMISAEELIDSAVSIGSFLEVDISQSLVSITIIRADQIQNSGARHLTELLEIYVPGFQYMYNKWNGIIWGMRGVASDRNTKFIFMVNGQKMNHESRDGAFSELDLGFLSDLDRVEVLRGPAGLVYGSGSIAGVINLVTHKYVQNKKVAEIGVETWSLKTYGTSEKLMMAQKLENGGMIQFYGGFRISQGSGMESPRIVGRPSWPFPQERSDVPSNGVPALGSSWDTPGNFILSSEYKVKDWFAYARVTHQVTNASGFFVLDPWPEINGIPDSTATPRLVDGKLERYNGFYGQVESSGNNRRQYRVDNASVQVTKDIKWQRDLLKIRAGMDLVSNVIKIRKLASYNSSNAYERENEEAEAFGERRFNLSGNYIFDRNNLKTAVGVDSRLFVFGNDLSGHNSQQEKGKHPIIDNVIYFNQAVFSESVYHIHKKLIFDAGLRYDLHSRTIIHHGLISSKIGLVYKLLPSTNLKFAYHSSGNNGSADNYEYNRNTFNDQGEPYQVAHFEVPTTVPNENSTPIEPVSKEELRSLKPEKSNSWELSGYYQKKSFVITGSASYNTIKDLFTWNQASFRVINAGKYHFVNFELDANHTTEKWAIGLSHVITQLVNTSVLNEKISLNKVVFDPKKYQSKEIDGQMFYFPIALKNKMGQDSSTQYTIYPIRDAISVDGKNFLNLASQVTKLFVDYSISKYLALHSDWRFFWGLNGRKDLNQYSSQNPILKDYEKDYENNDKYPYLGIENKAIVKWNIGIKLTMGKLTSQFLIYDLLSSKSNQNNINSIRWQQMANSRVQSDLYSYDFRSFALKLTYSF